jgi:hypothetical protein
MEKRNTVKQLKKIAFAWSVVFLLGCNYASDSLRKEWTYLGLSRSVVESELTKLCYSGRPGKIWYQASKNGVRESILVRYDSGGGLRGIVHAHESDIADRLDSIFSELSKERIGYFGKPIIDSTHRTGLRSRRWITGRAEETKWVELRYFKGMNVMASTIYARDSLR